MASIRKRTNLIVVHVSATPPSMDIGAAEIDRMHKAKGWSGIGYHFVVRRDGRVELGRPADQIGAHVEGWNSVSVGVCLVGGVDAHGQPQDNKTVAQTESLIALLGELVQRFPGAKICGHRDLSPDRDRDGVVEPDVFVKACRCFDAIPWAKAVGLPAAAIRGYWDRQAAPLVEQAVPDARTTYLQKLLARAGYAFGPIDGVVGDRTADAIEAFQKWNGLQLTRTFDEATARRLRERFEGKAAA